MAWGSVIGGAGHAEKSLRIVGLMRTCGPRECDGREERLRTFTKDYLCPMAWHNMVERDCDVRILVEYGFLIY